MTNGILLFYYFYVSLATHDQPPLEQKDGSVRKRLFGPRATLLSTELGVEIKFSGYRCIDTGIMKRSYKLDILIVVAFSR